MWKFIGQLIFWALWPALFIYLRIGERTRIAVVFEGEVLVVRPWLGSGKWILPGGGLHRGEDPRTGVLRELKEETGYIIDPKSVKSKGQKTITNNGISAQYHLFDTKISDKQTVDARKFEILEVRWLKLDEAKQNIAQLADLLE